MISQICLKSTLFISYYPLKQGLKPGQTMLDQIRLKYLYPTIH